MRPLYVQVDPLDNVAILVNEGGLCAGTEFDSGLVLREDIPEAHKVALRDVRSGEPILRYGSMIGYANSDIPAGSWIHEERMVMPVAPPLNELPLATEVPPPGPPIRTLRNLSLNPNLGGAPMVVSLGCEKLQPLTMLPSSTLPILSEGPYIIRMQDEEIHGFGETVAAIMSLAERRLQELNRRTRTTRPASDLIVGLQCGGSDAFSGVTANPAVGYASDLLVRAGATVMFSEVTEVRDAIHLLTARAANEDVARDLVREMAWYDEYLARGGADRSANPSPGNKRGGLTNIVEKALGSVAKAGKSAISGVTGPGERMKGRGLIFAATPASDFVCGTLQLAAGMNMHVFTTGRGTPYGLSMTPVIKVSSRSPLAGRWSDLIDIDAGRIATGEATLEEVGTEIFQMILDVASGRRQTWSEKWGLSNDLALFNPAPVT
jgi:galactarate dehydratase